jgi:hypothetical protein
MPIASSLTSEGITPTSVRPAAFIRSDLRLAISD